MRRSNAADDTLSGKLAQALDRVDGVDIALITAAIEVDRHVTINKSFSGKSAGRKRTSALPNANGVSLRRISAALLTMATRRSAKGGPDTKGVASKDGQAALATASRVGCGMSSRRAIALPYCGIGLRGQVSLMRSRGDMRALNGSNTLTGPFGVTLAAASRPSGSSSCSFSRSRFSYNETS